MQHTFPKITVFEGEGESKLEAEGRKKGQGEGLSRQQNQEVDSVHMTCLPLQHRRKANEPSSFATMNDQES